jgi:hypothetical protein
MSKKSGGKEKIAQISLQFDDLALESDEEEAGIVRKGSILDFCRPKKRLQNTGSKHLLCENS